MPAKQQHFNIVSVSMSGMLTLAFRSMHSCVGVQPHRPVCVAVGSCYMIFDEVFDSVGI